MLCVLSFARKFLYIVTPVFRRYQGQLIISMARTVLLPLGSSHSTIQFLHTTQIDASASNYTYLRNFSLVSLKEGCKRPVEVCASARNYANVEKVIPIKSDEKLKLIENSDKNKPLKFSYIFCDMDGTLINSKGLISPRTVQALKEATSRGIKIVMATGKSRFAANKVLETAGLTGPDGVFSDSSPGVFTQGLVVYGRSGQEIFRRNLDASICKEACVFSLEHNIPLVAFCENRCLTLFDHPMVDYLHTFYHEPKVEIIGSVEQLLETAEVQKLLFMDTDEGVDTFLRPYWSKATEGRARVVKAVPDTLEIVPLGSSKGRGVRILLEHLGVKESEVMAIGDGENDMEMLELAGLGVALSNGSEKAKAVADVIGLSNDEDGAADAIYRYAY